MQKLILASLLCLFAGTIAQAEQLKRDPQRWSDKVPVVDGAGVFYVAPDGKRGATGTKDAPWDIDSALGGAQKVPPGSVIWIRGGTYRFDWATSRKVKKRSKNKAGCYPVRLVGEKDKPIHIRTYPGERAILDGGLMIDRPSQYVWAWDLEIIVSENLKDWPTVNPNGGSHPSWFDGRVVGSLLLQSGPGHRMISLAIHHNTSGIAMWKTTPDAELHGCLVYKNGWASWDRNHGHGIYTQNRGGKKLITNNIFFSPADQFMSLYGTSKAPVRNYHVEGNVYFSAQKGSRNRALIGGSSNAQNVTVKDNLFYGARLLLGYEAKFNNAGISAIGNTIIRERLDIRSARPPKLKDNLIWKQGDPVPARPMVWVRPNKYDPSRAHLAVINLQQKKQVAVDLGKFLKAGESFEIRNAVDYFGKPVVSGKFSGAKVTVPMAATELTPKGEIGAFVVIRNPSGGGRTAEK